MHSCFYEHYYLATYFDAPVSTFLKTPSSYNFMFIQEMEAPFLVLEMKRQFYEKEEVI